jgi:hypothetical protein
MRRLPAVVVVCTLLCLSVEAQRAAFGGHFGGGGSRAAHFSEVSPAHFGGRPAGTGSHHGFHHGVPAGGSLISLEPLVGFGTGFGFDGGFFPSFPSFYEDEDDWQADAPPPQPTPQVIVLREPDGTYRETHAPLPTSQPKIIEVPGSRDLTTDPAADPPATLVLRDGKEVTVSRYTIMGQYLYDSSRPRHTTRVPLDQLDLKATERLNAQNGVPFALPTDSNEVMVRF